MESCLIVFLRNAEIGKVKTRIARTLGDKAALDIYHKLLQILKVTLKDLTCRTYLYFDGKPQYGWQDLEARQCVQADGDLGHRMAEAFADVFSLHSEARVLIIGSDCPALTADIINKAFRDLSQADVVIGPAEDGGYYMLGMKKLHRSLFEGISWSGPDVFKETVRKAGALGLIINTGPILFDIDTAADWERWQKLKSV